MSMNRKQGNHEREGRGKENKRIKTVKGRKESWVIILLISALCTSWHVIKFGRRRERERGRG